MLALASGSVTPSFSRAITLREPRAGEELLLGEGERQPDLALLMIGRTFAEDADDRVRLVVDPDRLADDRRVAAEAVLPEPVGEDDDLVATDRAFFLEEGAAERQRMPVAEHREEAGRGAAGRRRSPADRRWPTLTGPPPHALMSAKAVACRFHST